MKCKIARPRLYKSAGEAAPTDPRMRKDEAGPPEFSRAGQTDGVQRGSLTFGSPLGSSAAQILPSGRDVSAFAIAPPHPDASRNSAARLPLLGGCEVGSGSQAQRPPDREPNFGGKRGETLPPVALGLRSQLGPVGKKETWFPRGRRRAGENRHF